MGQKETIANTKTRQTYLVELQEKETHRQNEERKDLEMGHEMNPPHKNTPTIPLTKT